MADSTFVFFQGNTSTGTTARLEKFVNVRTVEYFGKVFTVDEFIQHAYDELNKIKSRTVLIGSSFGGHLLIYLAYHMITNNTELLNQIEKIVLAGTPPTDGNDSFPRAFNSPAEIIEDGGRPILELLSVPDVMTEAEATRFFLPTIGGFVADEETKRLVEENIRNLTTNALMGKTRHDIISTFQREPTELEMIKAISKRIPVLLVHAELDPVINLDYVKEVSAITGIPVRVIKNAPHYSHWTHPEEFLRSLN